MSTQRLALGLSVALALAAAVTLASTTTNTPGAACVGTTGTLAVTSAGAAGNPTASTIPAVCPADRTIAPTLSNNLSATVWVVDESSTGNVCCTANSANPLGGSIVISPQVCSTGKSANVQVLSLAQITDTRTFSQFYVACSLPAIEGGVQSLVLTYRTVQD